MTKTNMDLSELLAKHDQGDFLRTIAEAVLQLAGRAGPVQVTGVKRAAGHGSHGFAQQGNAVVVLEAV